MAEYIEREEAVAMLKRVGAPTYAIHALYLVKPTYAVAAPVSQGWNYCPNCGAKMDLED